MYVNRLIYIVNEMHETAGLTPLINSLYADQNHKFNVTGNWSKH